MWSLEATIYLFLSVSVAGVGTVCRALRRAGGMGSVADVEYRRVWLRNAIHGWKWKAHRIQGVRARNEKAYLVRGNKVQEMKKEALVVCAFRDKAWCPGCSHGIPHLERMVHGNKARCTRWGVCYVEDIGKVRKVRCIHVTEHSRWFAPGG